MCRNSGDLVNNRWRLSTAPPAPGRWSAEERDGRRWTFDLGPAGEQTGRGGDDAQSDQNGEAEERRAGARVLQRDSGA
jgi:hypothetical protein